MSHRMAKEYDASKILYGSHKNVLIMKNICRIVLCVVVVIVFAVTGVDLTQLILKHT